MKKDFNRTFESCPNCGSENRFFESLGDELKERGLARKEWSFCFDTRSGPVIDDKSISKVPYGTELPAYGIQVDVCMDCGIMYAPKLARLTAKCSLDTGNTNLPFGNN